MSNGDGVEQYTQVLGPKEDVSKVEQTCYGESRMVTFNGGTVMVDL